MSRRGNPKLKAFLDGWAEKQDSVQAMRHQILNVKRGSPRTVRAYIQSVHDFCEFLGNENADEVLVQFKKGEEKSVRHEIFQYIQERSKRLSPKTVNSQISAIKRWFKANEFSIKWDLVEAPPSQAIMDDRAPDVEELRQILSGDKISLRDKAFITLAATTGLRAGTLLSLKLGDVLFDVEEEANKVDDYYEAKTTPEMRLQIRKIAMIKVNMAPGRKLRGKKSFFSFVPSETVGTLKEYMSWRKRNGEELTDDSWLIGKEQPNHSHERMYVVQMGHHWRKILERQGFKGNGQKWHPLHLHTLRKFHTTQTATVRSYPPIWRGQKQGEYLDTSYFRPNLIDHLKAFLSVEPKLCISMTPDLKRLAEETRQARSIINEQRVRIEELEKQNAELKARLNGFTLSDDQVQQLLRRIEKLERLANQK